MSKYETEYLKEAFKHSRLHKQEILQSCKPRVFLRGESCGCFNCKKIFKPAEIKEWAEEGNFMINALCPHCGMISVIGSKSGYPVNDAEFLEELNLLFLELEKEKDVNLLNEFNKFRSHDRGY